MIELRNVSTVFGSRPADMLPLLPLSLTKAEILERYQHVVAVRRVSCYVEKGQLFVIMGLSGSGKSTLIRYINRLMYPIEGEVLVDGRNILDAGARELQHLRQTKVSMVFQHFALFPHKTVLDNAAYGLEARGETKAAGREKALIWISRVGLRGYENKFPSQLSGGMQQRVGLARALATDPEVLLMDEAFSALDPLIRGDMQRILLDLQLELRKTIVFITHDLDEALAIGDRIAILRDGAIVQEGTPAEIVMNPTDDYVSGFVKNVNRARALSVRSVMRQRPPGAAATVDDRSVRSDDTLETALSRVICNEEPVPVFDGEGEFCGEVTRKQLVSAIVRR